jgi:hypothetical protein
VVKKHLGNLLRCWVGDNARNWDIVLSQENFTYNNLVNYSTWKIEFEIVIGVNPRGVAKLRDINMNKRSAKEEDFIDFRETLYNQVQNNLEDMKIKYKDMEDEH